MAREASQPEKRVLQALRQANIITATQMRAAMDLLEATETCDRCGGAGMVGPSVNPPIASQMPCPKCEGSGQMRTIR